MEILGCEKIMLCGSDLNISSGGVGFMLVVGRERVREFSYMDVILGKVWC